MNVRAACQLTMMEVYRLNPGVRLSEPVWENEPGASTELCCALFERRNGPRHRRRSCKSHRKSTSFVHVPGGTALLESSACPA